MAPSLAHFGGEERFAAPPERLFNELTDFQALTAAIPDLVSSEVVDATTLKCVVRPGFSFLRGTLKLTLSLTETQPPRLATMRVAGQGIGVSLQVASRLQIENDGAGSRLEWEADIEQMSGLVASISPALVKAAADQVIRHAWEKLRARLGEAP